MRPKSTMGPFLFSLVAAAGFVALVVSSGKSHSLQNMAAHAPMAKPNVDTSAVGPETNLRLIEDRPRAFAPDALLRPGLEIEDGTAFLNSTK